MTRYRIVQHSFGSLGSGGPIAVLQGLIRSPLATEYEFLSLHQEAPLGGISASTIGRWTRWLRAEKPDMIHVQGLGNEGFHAVAAARTARVPKILVSVHGTHRDLQTGGTLAQLRSSIVSHTLEPATLRGATHIATVCEYASKRAFIARYADKSVGVVPNGVEVGPLTPGIRAEYRRKLGIPPEAMVLISVGRLTEEKGLKYLVSALIGLNGDSRSPEEIHLLIVGEGPALSSLAAELAKLTSIRTHFLGRRQDVRELLETSDIFVFPSLHENLSMALLEAMSAGLPVVASNVGGNTEVVKGAGLLVPAGDAAALRQAVAQLVESPAARKELGAKARQRVQAKYSSQIMVQSWRSVYEEILRGNPQRPRVTPRA